MNKRDDTLGGNNVVPTILKSGVDIANKQARTNESLLPGEIYPEI